MNNYATTTSDNEQYVVNGQIRSNPKAPRLPDVSWSR